MLVEHSGGDVRPELARKLSQRPHNSLNDRLILDTNVPFTAFVLFVSLLALAVAIGIAVWALREHRWAAERQRQGEKAAFLLRDWVLRAGASGVERTGLSDALKELDEGNTSLRRSLPPKRQEEYPPLNDWPKNRP